MTSAVATDGYHGINAEYEHVFALDGEAFELSNFWSVSSDGNIQNVTEFPASGPHMRVLMHSHPDHWSRDPTATVVAKAWVLGGWPSASEILDFVTHGFE